MSGDRYGTDPMGLQASRRRAARGGVGAEHADAGPTPFDRRPWVAERRQQPRRHEEGLVHYAKEALVGAALGLVDAAETRQAVPTMEALGNLADAVEAYRFAEAALVTANKERAAQQPALDEAGA